MGNVQNAERCETPRCGRVRPAPLVCPPSIFFNIQWARKIRHGMGCGIFRLNTDMFPGFIRNHVRVVCPGKRRMQAGVMGGFYCCSLFDRGIWWGLPCRMWTPGSYYSEYDMPQAWAVWKYLVSRTLSEHNSNDSQKSCLCRQTFAAERRIRQWEFRHLGVRSLGRLFLFGFQSRVWLFIIIFTSCSFSPRVVRGGGSGGGHGDKTQRIFVFEPHINTRMHSI